MSTYLYDDTQWSVEPADPSVGIFGETVAHETCPKEYEEGAEVEFGRLTNRHVKNHDMVYADQEITFRCLDCGASTKFTDEAFMGFDGEYGV